MTMTAIEGADITQSPTPCKTCGELPKKTIRPDGKTQFQCCTPGVYGWGGTEKSAAWVWNKINQHARG
jgi:hypothetical protein